MFTVEPMVLLILLSSICSDIVVKTASEEVQSASNEQASVSTSKLVKAVSIAVAPHELSAQTSR